MGKLLVRKIIVALVFAIVSPFVVAALLSGMTEGLTLANGELLNSDNLTTVVGMTDLLIVIGVLTFLISLGSAFLVPSRRRRQRSSGTIVESACVAR